MMNPAAVQQQQEKQTNNMISSDKPYVCEHCGRILVDVIAPPVEEAKPKKTRKKKTA